jgi:diamine N-acetyltransferase
MNYSIYLRELNLIDAQISYKWRNNPMIWKYTAFRSDTPITYEMEVGWLKNALLKSNDHRFAICLKSNSQYIGNVQLLNVDSNTANFHLFIGEPSFWGMGIGKEACVLMLKFGFLQLELNSISLEVHEEHHVAQSIYKKIGFKDEGIKQGAFKEMSISKDQMLISHKNMVQIPNIL